ncbi:uncharacterized protein LOC111884433 [Lactuca sativa]|uniref:uncharacterized protein LOC111884433 n=1 Tax=Lactuca sativa TaxID=4236 RepID=UPI000CD9BB59|nr:uncharacterized protein LOC111884433 [Lactuca sativa]
MKPPSQKRKAPTTSTAAPKRRKQPARRRKYPTLSPSQIDDKNSDSETESEIRIEEDPPIRNEDVEPIHTEEQEQVRTEREVTPPINEYVPSPPPSPKTTTSVLITIAPLPIVSSQAPTMILVSIPIFIDSMIPPQPSSAPECSVNVSDTGANTSGFSTHVTPPISPISTDDPKMFFGDDDDEDLEAFSFSPFQIRVDNNDDVSTSKAEFKSIHEKLDQLLLTSSTSTSEAYSKADVEAILELVTKEHTANSSSFSKVVSDSAAVCKETTEKVDKLITDTRVFMDEYQVTYNNNTSTTNKVIQNVGAMFKGEKTSFVELRTEFKSDHEAFQASVDAKLSKLQANLAMETETGVRDAAPFGGCFDTDVVSETRGEGSSKVHTEDVKPKVSVKPPVIKQDPKNKDPLFSNESIIDDSEDEEPDEVELKRQKAREAEIDEHARIVREAEDKERAEKEAHATLKSKMLLFPK